MEQYISADLSKAYLCFQGRQGRLVSQSPGVVATVYYGEIGNQKT